MIGVALVSIFYVVVRPMLRAKKGDPLARQPMFSPSQHRVVEREMQNLLVELTKMTQAISAQLDTRAAKLELLIEDADRKIAQLQSIPARPPAEPAPVASLASQSSRPPNGEALDGRYARIYALADSGQDAHQIAAELDRPQGEVELILALRRK